MPDEFAFEALARLRETLAAYGRAHVSTMRHYASDDGRGFLHNPRQKKADASAASTATCVSALVRAGRWDIVVDADTGAPSAPSPNQRSSMIRPWGTTKDVADTLATKICRALQEARSAEDGESGAGGSGGLSPTNPFTMAFLAEGLLDFVDTPYEGRDAHMKLLMDEVKPLLLQEFYAPETIGSVRIKPYPPSAYLTQLAYRVLRDMHQGREDTDFEKLTSKVRNWAKAELNRQMVLITMKLRTADPMQMAYAVLLVASASAAELSTPEEKAITTAAIDLFFRAQNDDGSWPPSQPLFHYPKVGNAQCFEYELLTQMLVCSPLQELLLSHLTSFDKAVNRLAGTAFHLEGSLPGERPLGWASGHHPQLEGPESWSTACVYDFAHTLGRLVAEAIRRTLFKEVSVEYTPPLRPDQSTPKVFGKEFLDAELFLGGISNSLTDTLLNSFVLPIRQARGAVYYGGKLDKKVPMSAILFGPPGTSKTELAKKIAQCVGWPLLSVDPSYLVQDGLDQLYSRANRLFSMLAMSEQVVAFLDEFDEMGRERTDNADISSRFITTAMLPKLAAINKSRQIVIILATNYIANFDAAFSRGGRFDTIVQVMPPTYEQKLLGEGGDIIKAVVEGAPEPNRPEAKAAVADLTFLETAQLVARLKQKDSDGLQEILKAAEVGTLARRHGPEETWKTASVRQREHIRLPPNIPLPLVAPTPTLRSPEGAKLGSFGAGPESGYVSPAGAPPMPRTPDTDAEGNLE